MSGQLKLRNTDTEFYFLLINSTKTGIYYYVHLKLRNKKNKTKTFPKNTYNIYAIATFHSRLVYTYIYFQGSKCLLIVLHSSVLDVPVITYSRFGTPEVSTNILRGYIEMFKK